MRISTVCMILFFSIATHAGFKVGNGGMIAVCTQDSQSGIRAVEVPDALEARFRWNLNLKYSDKTSWMEKVQDVLGRMAGQDHWRQQYSLWLSQFISESRFLDGELPDTADGFHLPLPVNCHIKQVVVQVDPEVPQEARYYINKAWWDKMDEDQKALMVLHELIYRQAKLEDKEDSRWVRYLNVLIWSDEFKNLDSQFQSKLFLQLLRYPFWLYQGFPVTQVNSATDFVLGPGPLNMTSNGMNWIFVDSGKLTIDKDTYHFTFFNLRTKLADQSQWVFAVVAGTMNRQGVITSSEYRLASEDEKNGASISKWHQVLGKSQIKYIEDDKNQYYSFSFREHDHLRICRPFIIPEKYVTAEIEINLLGIDLDRDLFGYQGAYAFSVFDGNQIVWNRNFEKRKDQIPRFERMQLNSISQGKYDICISITSAVNPASNVPAGQFQFKDFDVVIK
jgi:hypothetical protein